jgi:hypothetical protein
VKFPETITGNRRHYLAEPLSSGIRMKCMNDTPDWIKRRNAKKKSDSAQSAEDDRQNVEAASLIAAQGPEIWQRFLKGLAINATALSKLEGEELVGAVTPIGPPGAEVSCQVNVNRHGLPPQLSSLVFHYTHRSNAIRVTRMTGEQDFLPFQIARDGVLGIHYQGQLLSPEQTAEAVIQGIIDAVTR